MSGFQKIFVDFNNRLNRGDGNEYYRVSLSELESLEVGSTVIATDLEDIELWVRVSAKLHLEKVGIVQVVRVPAMPRVSVTHQPSGYSKPIRAEKLKESGTKILAAY